VQYICHQRLRADGHDGSKDTQTSSDEESEAEEEEEEEESDDEFSGRTTEHAQVGYAPLHPSYLLAFLRSTAASSVRGGFALEWGSSRSLLYK
jgi:hypothetical protein